MVFGFVASVLVLSGAPGVAAAGRGLPTGLAGLPAAAQGPVSAALGRAEPAYRVVGLRAGNPAQRLRTVFSPGGVVVYAGGGPCWPGRFGLWL
jgi:hypothetical protein